MANEFVPATTVKVNPFTGLEEYRESISRLAILAEAYGSYKTPYTDTAGSRGGQMLNDKSDSPKVVTFKGSNNIPLKIGTAGWYFCDTDADITLPNDLDDYLADVVIEDGTGVWTASANVTSSTDAGKVKLAVAAGFATGLLGYIDRAAVDMSLAGTNAISFLVTSSINLYHGDLQLLLDEDAGCVSASETLIIPGLKANVQTRVIVSLASAAAARDAIISIGLNATRDFGAADIWIDDIKTTSIEAGKDYFVYACDNAGALVFKVSKASTFPAGFAAATSRKIGGFHTIAGAVGTIAGHSLTTFDTADINPYSIWDLKHRPRSTPAGMRYVPGISKWVDIYQPSGVTIVGGEYSAGTPVSVNGGTMLDTLNWPAAVQIAAMAGKRLMWDSEFQIAASGANEETNILGSADPVTTGPHIDTAGRRMISNTGGEDECGVMRQWLQDQSYRYDADGTMAAAAKTLPITHAAAPGGNPIYVKYGSEGRPYLCCNMATDAVDKWLTFGAAVTLLIKHDANAATAGYQVYFDEDATEPGRLLCALPGLKTDYLDTSDPNYPLKIAYNAAPGTPGVAISFDDGADERLEFISPTAANGTIDLASYALSWAYYDLPGGKGSLYKQSSYGDVKLLAGGFWPYGSYCGSRGRNAYNSRWNTSPAIGARFVSEPL